MFKKLNKKAVATTAAAVAIVSSAVSANAAGLDLKAPTDSGLPSATDVILSSWSFASNFWEFVLLGIAILVTPALFAIARAAIGRKKKSA